MKLATLNVANMDAGPHIGVNNAWPMSLLVQARTTDDDAEIKELVELVLKYIIFGLVHESIHVDYIADYTRSWFACKSSTPRFSHSDIDGGRG